MYQEDEFYRIIKEKTGRSIEDNSFGFICGTIYPYISKTLSPATNKYGYRIWKKDLQKDGTTKTIETDATSWNIKDIIIFLNDKDSVMTYLNKGAFLIDYKGKIVKRKDVDVAQG